ncbi:helix-turn-helix domain-containing protein [Desulfothermus naphthae]
MDFQEFLKKNLDQKILKNLYWEFISKENKIRIYFPHHYYKEYFVINFLKSIKNKLKNNYKIELTISDKKKVSSQINTNFLFNINYDINNFFYTDENKLTIDTILKIIKDDIINYNPIIIYGLNNSGKTHLLKSIGNLYLKNKPNYKIFYFNLKNLNYVNFKNYFSNYFYDILLLDNIHEINYDEKFQISLLNLLNKYLLKNKIVYITTNKKIIDIKNLNDNLKSFLNGGLILKLKLPNLYTKLKCTNFFCKKYNLELSHSQIFEIATKHKTIADIKAYLYRLLVRSNLKKENIPLILKEKRAQNSYPKISTKKIIEIVAKYYGVTPKQIISKSQKKNIALARHVAIYLCKDLLKLPSIKLAKIFKRDHTTILYSLKKINNLKELDSNFNIMLKDVSKKCTDLFD